MAANESNPSNGPIKTNPSNRADPPIDELRQRLRALGYLDAGVDRFVLASVGRARRPALIALFASLRIGILAGALLGPAAAIGLTARVPGLVTGPRDAVIVALYFSVLFGAAAAAVALAATSIASWVARRSGPARNLPARRIAGGAGVLVSAGCLTYLTLWWRAAEGTIGSSTAATAFALAVAAAISVLLGHAVTVTAAAVITAAAGTSDPGYSRMSRGPWRTMAAGGVIAFLASVVLLVFTATASESDARSPSPLAVVSSGLRVRLIAIDGVDSDFLFRLSAAGRVPALGAALNGPRATFHAEAASDPARTWTTIATGQPPEIHGVRGLETRRVAGLQGSVAAEASTALARALRGATDLVRLTRPAAASGTERRAKTVWEVAAGAGLRTAVVNWWATWPAPLNDGIVVSDRAVLRLERGGELNGEIAPRAVYDQLLGQWPRMTAAVRAQIGTVGDGTPPSIREVLRRSAELDALQVALTRQVWTKDIDLLCVYFPGLDLVQHALLTAVDSRELTASAVARRVAALESYYTFLDPLLRDLLKAGEGELIVVVAAPGRVGSATTGVFAISGSLAGRTQAVEAHSVDVMPTVLHALGVPMSRELTGRPLLSLFAEDFVRRYPVREVAGYGRPAISAASPAGTPLDQEMIDRLRSLGYVR